MSVYADDYYLKALRACSHQLDHLASVASGRGKYELANKLWACQYVVDEERTNARVVDGLRFMDQLPKDQRWPV